MKNLITKLLFITILFTTGCTGLGNGKMGDSGTGFYFGVCLIGLLMLMISLIRMIFAGFENKELKFFVIGAVLFLIG